VVEDQGPGGQLRPHGADEGSEGRRKIHHSPVAGDCHRRSAVLVEVDPVEPDLLHGADHLAHNVPDPWGLRRQIHDPQKVCELPWLSISVPQDLLRMLLGVRTSGTVDGCVADCLSPDVLKGPHNGAHR
jgi:hypothetical protein